MKIHLPADSTAQACLEFIQIVPSAEQLCEKNSRKKPDDNIENRESIESISIVNNRFSKKSLKFTDTTKLSKQPQPFLEQSTHLIK